MSTIANTESFLRRLFSYSDTKLTPGSLKEAVAMAYSKLNITEVELQVIIKRNIK